MPDLLGIIAALTGPFLLTIGLTVWDKRWKGHYVSLNLFKCTIATIIFLIILSIYYSTQFTDFSEIKSRYNYEDTSWLLFSSFIGIIIGDNFWLFALQILGVRKLILVDCLKPFMACFLSWLYLGETGFAKPNFILGLVLCCSGVFVTALETSGEETVESDVEATAMNENKESIENVTKTTFLDKMYNQKDQTTLVVMARYSVGALNVTLDMFARAFTKEHSGVLNTIEINTIRFGSCVVVIGIASLIARLIYSKNLENKNMNNESETASELRVLGTSWYEMPNQSVKNWIWCGTGVVFVTFACPTLTIFALMRLSFVLQDALTSVGPIYTIPVVYFIKNEKVSLKGWASAVMCMAGIFILVLWK